MKEISMASARNLRLGQAEAEGAKGVEHRGECVTAPAAIPAAAPARPPPPRPKPQARGRHSRAVRDRHAFCCATLESCV
eukprot:3236589-Prymnesium_polylepis.2